MKTYKYNFIVAVAVVLLAAGCGKAPVPKAVTPPPADIHMQERVEGSDQLVQVTIHPGETKTALDILRTTHTITTKTFSGIGEYVESIDGVKPDGKHFWAFYVNNVQSQVGAGSYVPKDGDRIDWKLESIQPN